MTLACCFLFRVAVVVGNNDRGLSGYNLAEERFDVAWQDFISACSSARISQSLVKN